jgi:hypothetical protein
MSGTQDPKRYKVHRDEISCLTILESCTRLKNCIYCYNCLITYYCGLF